MKQTKRILSLLLAVFMIAATFVMPAFADSETAVTPLADDDTPSGDSGVTSTVEGLELSKVYDETTKKLTLEAYVTGGSQTILTTEPADIALVLDVSGSMSDKIEVANGYDDLSKLDTVYGGEEGTYTAKFDGGIGEYQLRYNSEKSYWEYYKKLLNSGWTEIGSNIYDITNIYTTKLNAVKMAVKHFIDETEEIAPESKISVVSFSDSATTVCELTTVSGNANTLKAAGDGLTADGGTHPEDGLTNAKNALSASDRQKVVIMFTDGAPGAWLLTSFNDSVANEAIANSLELKNDGALVYTIGCFGSLDSDLETKIDKYMNYVSSNYPKASNLDTPGTANESQRYYHTTDTSTELTEIFKAISKETGGAANTKLTEKTVIKDIIGDHFVLPAEGTVTVEVYSYTGKDEWTKTDDVITPTVEGKTITVTGFDFSANWVGEVKNSSGAVESYHGKKIVIVIDIDVDPESPAYGETETNAAGSGVYDENGEMLNPFPRPTCDIPYFTIKHTSSAADEKIPLHSLEDGTLNFTEKVASGYLYGGTFTSATFNADTALESDPTNYTPADGAVYYVREVSANYLVPKNTIVWDNNGALNSFYLLSTIDDYNLYDSVGFWMFGCYEDVDTVYKTVDVQKMKNGTPKHDSWLYAVNGTIQSAAILPDSTDSYIMLMNVGDDFIDVGDNQFAAYWVTLDGVRVLGKDARIVGYDSTKTQRDCVTYEDNEHAMLPKYVGVTPAPTMLRAAAYYRMGAGNDITVTVVDGDTYKFNVQPGDISEYVSYNGAEGKVFAGWYLDEEFTTPADLANVYSATTLYARYVDAGYLKVKFVEQRLFRVYGVKFASAIVDTDLSETGYIINGERVAINLYSTRFALMNARTLFGNGVERGAYMMCGSYDFRNAADGDELTITPYWVTADGTFVTGESRTLVWHPYWVEG